MWISKKNYEVLKLQLDATERARLGNSQDLDRLTARYSELLCHLKLSEWIEPATPVVPQKTVLITEKERAKRVKEGRKSYADPLFCGASGGSGEMRVAFPWTSKNVKLFNRI